jgi:integrase
VLLNRRLRPDSDPAAVSMFGDGRWNLSPAIFEDHYTTMTIGFGRVPDQFVLAAKHYLWAELNTERPPALKHARMNRLAVYTHMVVARRVRTFLTWLDARGVERLTDVTGAHYDGFVADLLESAYSHSDRVDIVNVVRRMWVFRELLPPPVRLPEPLPWDGHDSRALLGRSPRERRIENRTPRIGPATMEPLLAWALRFTEDFSTDIIAALGEVRPFRGRRGADRRARYPHRSGKGPHGGLYRDITALIERLRAEDRPLPGRLDAHGQIGPDWAHLARLMDTAPQGVQISPHRVLFADSGLPIVDGAHLEHQVSGLLDGRPWLEAIDYHQVEELTRVLVGACAIVICYLSGARVGEVLTLRRGCIEQDPATGLWLMHGRKWKGARDGHGAKVPEGQIREHPWVVAEPVAHAIAVLEQMHASDLLFSAVVLGKKPSGRDRARSTAEIGETITEFIDWVNVYCRAGGRRDTIPADPAGVITPSRFRRTLAWFICHRPRGLVACALQYGHLHVQMTLGYSGTYASGFPDETALEQWLTRLEDLEDAERRLQAGEHVSGPAADRYRARVWGGSDRFAGRVIRSGRQASSVLANPSLQIYPGEGMTCVFDPSTALCQMRATTSGDDRSIPDLNDCRPACRNIARTDRDMAGVRQHAARLRPLVDDPLRGHNKMCM